MRMDDVYLQGDTPDGSAVVGNLSVIVDAGGLTVLGPAPGARRTVGWDRLSAIELGPPATLPSGQSVSSLQFVVDGRPLRILVPAGTAAGAAAEMTAGMASGAASGPAGALLAEEAGAVAVAVRPLVAGAGDGPELADPNQDGPVGGDTIVDDITGFGPGGGFDPTTGHDAWPAVEDPRSAPDPDGPVGEDDSDDDDDWAPVPAAMARRSRPASASAPHKRVHTPHHLRRLVLVTAVVGLLPLAAALWYIRTAPPPAPLDSVPDHALAVRVGIQPAEVPGWQAVTTPAGNVFAAGATTQGPAAARTAQQASSVLARCLHVPVSALDGAFAMGGAAAQRTAQVGSPTYLDPAGDGGTVSSVVDVERSAQMGTADAGVFADPSLFATCYQPFVQAMLPYAGAGAPTGGYATATVQPTVVPVPDDSPNLTVAAFQIARIGNEGGQSVTSITTAVAVFGGRVQATVSEASDLVFPLDTQDTLVRDIEARVIGVSLL